MFVIVLFVCMRFTGELRHRLMSSVPTVQRHVCPVPTLHGCFPTSAQPYLAVTPSLVAIYADLLRRCRGYGSAPPSSIVVCSSTIPAAASSSGLTSRHHPDEAEDVEASSAFLVSSSSSAANSSATPRKSLSADIKRYHPYGKTA